jgi:NADPH:quinone reductase-like Zn-dependent oxidoreductase
VSAGNEEKVQFLQTKFHIPRNRIFNSRDASFLPDLMRETNDRGVDLVLNSLSGDLLHASWQCVAPGGRFIELGKRDFIGRGRLNMDIFEDNRYLQPLSYCCLWAVLISKYIDHSLVLT